MENVDPKTSLSSSFKDLNLNISNISPNMNGHVLSPRDHLPELDTKIKTLFASVQLLLQNENLLSKSEIKELKDLINRITPTLPKPTLFGKNKTELQSIIANIKNITTLLDQKAPSSPVVPPPLRNTLYIQVLIKEGKEEEALSLIHNTSNPSNQATGYSLLLKAGGTNTGLVLKDIETMSPENLKLLAIELSLHPTDDNIQIALTQIPSRLFEKKGIKPEEGIKSAIDFLNMIKNPDTKLTAYHQLIRAPGADTAIKKITDKPTKTNLQELSEQSFDQQFAKKMGRLQIELSHLLDIAPSPESLNNWMSKYSTLINERPDKANLDTVKMWIECCANAKDPLEKEPFFGLASVPMNVQMAMINHCDPEAIVKTFPEMRSNYENDIPDKDPNLIVSALNRDFARSVSSIEIHFNGEELDTSKASKDTSTNELTESIRKLDISIAGIDSIKLNLNSNITDVKKALLPLKDFTQLIGLTNAINTILSKLDDFNPNKTISENISILRTDFNLNGFDINKPAKENAQIIIKNNDLKGLSTEETESIEWLAQTIKNLKTGTEAPLTKLTSQSLDPTLSITATVKKILISKLNLIRSFKEESDPKTKTISNQDTLITLENKTINDINILSTEEPKSDLKSIDITIPSREKQDAIDILKPYGLDLIRTGTSCKPLTNISNFDNALELTKEVIGLHKKVAPLASKDETLELLHAIKLTTSTKGLSTLQGKFQAARDFHIKLNESLKTMLNITATDKSLSSTNTFYIDVLNTNTDDVKLYKNEIYFDLKKRLCAVQVSLTE